MTLNPIFGVGLARIERHFESARQQRTLDKSYRIAKLDAAYWHGRPGTTCASYGDYPFSTAIIIIVITPRYV
jgi:hypothetical protein